MSKALLFFQCFYIPLFEIIEVGAGFWFQFTYDDRLSSDSGVMRGNLVWIVLATAVLLLKRILLPFIFCGKDPFEHPTYHGIYRRITAATDSSNSSNEARKQYLLKSAKSIYMRAQWVSWCLSIANIVIIGIAHLDEGITAASATTQVPSWYIGVYTIVAHFLWNTNDLKELDSGSEEDVIA
eukprot:TRINITY_DN7348_c0_g1_i1.p1 TRINITY_DN7348_c0_g1~~TRINITY_DN7348_c0_g1_i1.p1  ORF type:complete len:204 (+),score=41.39 TRINITY_DN7348_c0_g1_i1:67-612(+)